MVTINYYTSGLAVMKRGREILYNCGFSKVQLLKSQEETGEKCQLVVDCRQISGSWQIKESAGHRRTA